ncbi:hypothetical protein DFH07DRAFT_954715 [Mycena maculata]|uniref:Peptidase A1 domain-containing protein n=1 Tax=Mycena maculata TaxID=230809 RepID=A0AAD7JMM4_9AGAR|nr:hypothetical protein DFH07DRAFT_954715 [Mycena maculata]
MATSASSTSDCFMIELKIATLDAIAELNDATGARIRYLTRREIAAPTVSSSSIAGRSALSVIPQDPLEVIDIPPMANFIPVHADLGPDPARNIQAYDQFLTTTTPTESLGPYCQVVGTLVFGNPMTPQNGRRYFNVEFDLEYELWTDFVYLHPYWGPPPIQEPDKAWLHLTFGVASQVSPSYRRAPTSGILGLGRRSVLDNRLTRSPTFLQQIRPLLESPELTILLAATRGFVYDVFTPSVIMTTDSHITFGRRPKFGNVASDKFGPWYNHLPVLGNEHWVVASTTKKLDGKTYTYNNGTAELDTGAAFCYLDNKFVKDFYACIPGCTIKNLGHLTLKHQFYHLIPVEVNATPRVELDIGGHLFTLEHSRLPQATTYDIKGKMYYVGAIQRKALLMADSDGAAFDGPDLIGRVALVNMEVVLQMPDHGPHTMSWRRKETSFTGPGKLDW